MKRFFAVALLFTVSACGGSLYAPVDNQQGGGSLELSYGPCFGTCPVFSVTLDDAGGLTYEGQRNVSVLGREQRQLGSSVFWDAVLLIDSVPPSELVDPIECPRRHTDAKAVYGTLKTATHDIEIHHYYGCNGYEYRARQVAIIRELTDLLQIDDLVGWLSSK